MNKETTNDELARMVAGGFKETNERMTQGFKETNERINNLGIELGDFRIETKERFKQVDDHLEHIDARLDSMAKDIATIQRHFVYRYEFDDLMGRVKYLEEKMGVESGK